MSDEEMSMEEQIGEMIISMDKHIEFNRMMERRFRPFRDEISSLTAKVNALETRIKNLEDRPTYPGYPGN